MHVHIPPQMKAHSFIHPHLGGHTEEWPKARRTGEDSVLERRESPWVVVTVMLFLGWECDSFCSRTGEEQLEPELNTAVLFSGGKQLNSLRPLRLKMGGETLGEKVCMQRWFFKFVSKLSSNICLTQGLRLLVWNPYISSSISCSWKFDKRFQLVPFAREAVLSVNPAKSEGPGKYFVVI